MSSRAAEPIAAALTAGVVFARLVWQMTGAADFPAHIAVARGLFAAGPVPVHPGYHVLVAAAHTAAPGNDWRLAAAAVTLGGVMALAGILGGWVSEALPGMRRGARMLAVVMVPLGLLLVQPALPWPQPRNQWLSGYISVNQWHNPTTLLVRPFGLALFGYAVAALSGAAITRRRLLWIGGLSLASLLIKPNALLALLPALGAGALLRWRGVRWRVVAAIAAPAVIGLLAQYLYYFDGAAASSRVELRPFYVIGLGSSTDPWTLWSHLLAAVLFPLVVTLTIPAARADAALVTAWAVFAAGAAQAYLLAEGGGDADAGNFMWSATIANAMLYAVAAVALLRALAAAPRPWPVARRVAAGACATVFAYHLLSGVTHIRQSWFG